MAFYNSLTSLMVLAVYHDSLGYDLPLTLVLKGLNGSMLFIPRFTNQGMSFSHPETRA